MAEEHLAGVKFARHGREKGGQKYRVFADFPQNFLVAGRSSTRSGSVVSSSSSVQNRGS